MDKNKRPSGKREPRSDKPERSEKSEERQSKPDHKERDKRLTGERRPRVIREDQKKSADKPYRREPTDQGRRSYGDSDKRSGSDDRNRGERKPYKKPYDSDRPARKPYGSDRPERKPYDSDRPERKPYDSDRPARKPYGSDRPERKPYDSDRPARKPFGSDRPEKSGRPFEKPARRFGSFGSDEDKPRPERKQYSPDRARKTPRTFGKPDAEPRPYREERGERSERKRPDSTYDAPEDIIENTEGEEPTQRPERKPRTARTESYERKERPERNERPERTFDKPDRDDDDADEDEPKSTFRPKPFRREREETEGKRPYNQRKTEYRGRPERKERPERLDDDGMIRLNKYVANSGICSRREADKLIEAGAISVNGVPVTELGTKVSPLDKIKYGDQTLSREKPRYVLLNKPKGFITTTDDPENRKTVMNLIAKACKERIYPIGRLDRNTTGLLLFTNDGDMAKKLAHPRYGIKKIYHVVLDKNLTKTDMKKIADGLTLDDGQIRVDAIEYIEDAKDKKEIGIELHSGKNRVVRRIFEALEYKVVRLDRVVYAGLTKKNLPRGEWRFLEQKEINMLKIIS
jgi:23S rRNA pseudouridine2605 synthase